VRIADEPGLLRVARACEPGRGEGEGGETGGLAVPRGAVPVGVS
jgi:hypothetical protein